LVDPSTIDVVYVPMVAFDSTKNRIGMGAGYYDRFLQTYSNSIIGVAFDFQECKHIQTNKYDVPMDTIITNKK
jgi:5-formyltetrahydrofolate cyclo-ligase